MSRTSIGAAPGLSGRLSNDRPSSHHRSIGRLSRSGLLGTVLFLIAWAALMVLILMPRDMVAARPAAWIPEAGDLLSLPLGELPPALR